MELLVLNEIPVEIYGVLLSMFLLSICLVLLGIIFKKDVLCEFSMPFRIGSIIFMIFMSFCELGMQIVMLISRILGL